MYTEKVTIDMADIFMILLDFEYNQPSTSVTMYRFENLVEHVVRPLVMQGKSSITLEDFTLYVGALASLIWSNRQHFDEHPPLTLSVKQNTNGSFSSHIEYL